MTLDIFARIKEAEPISSERLLKAVRIYDERMEKADIEYQRKNRNSETKAATARLTD